jgi:hypothetical protein
MQIFPTNLIIFRTQLKHSITKNYNTSIDSINAVTTTSSTTTAAFKSIIVILVLDLYLNSSRVDSRHKNIIILLTASEKLDYMKLQLQHQWYYSNCSSEEHQTILLLLDQSKQQLGLQWGQEVSKKSYESFGRSGS